MMENGLLEEVKKLHGVWLIGLWQRLCPIGAQWRGALLFLLAALSPLVSFYLVLVLDRWRGLSPAGPRRVWWRLLPLPLSLILLALTAARFELQYVPEDRNLAGALDQFGLMLGYWAIAVAILYMAARVFQLTRQALPTSQVLLLPAMAMVLMAFS